MIIIIFAHLDKNVLYIQLLREFSSSVAYNTYENRNTEKLLWNHLFKIGIRQRLVK